MAEYIVDTTDGILHARTTGELVRCGDCVHHAGQGAHTLGWCSLLEAPMADRDYCSLGSSRHRDAGVADGTRGEIR